MTYKGYTAYIEFDDDAGIFHGEVLDTKDVITFQGTSVTELKKAFKDSVEDYLAFCKERGEEPDKPFSGKFILRLPKELHRKIYIKAIKNGQSINNYITKTLDSIAE
ncbi:MAG: type II toxin-antitoxin system HicB family antitoxin [Bacteroidetes bacterium]|nr:type II toxin-antitoxin system HicB family antitoxin [Bacteroidota bacterium]MCL6100431.1 type II toxin-antitoxin system HicB family antitoxin [Bacteroidota bacterium]